MIEAGADKFAGQIPTILKLNSSNSLAHGGYAPSEAITGSVAEAVSLGCNGVGFTIYPGSDAAFDMIGQFQEMAAEAKALGLAVVLWSYPRGGGLSKPGETALDIAATRRIWRPLSERISSRSSRRRSTWNRTPQNPSMRRPGSRAPV